MLLTQDVPHMPEVDIHSKRMLRTYTPAEATLLAERIGLTLEQLKKLHRAANDTYQYIGQDLGPGLKTREEIIEVVLDADHINQHVKDAVLITWLRQKSVTYPMEHLYEAMALGFMFPRYE